MKILYVIAKYGEDHSGNLIHREIAHEFQRCGHEFHVFAFASAHEIRGSAPDTVEENIRVYRAVAAGTTLTDGLNALTKPILHYDRFFTGALALGKYLSQNAFDVVMVEGAYPFGAMFTLSAPQSAKMIVTVAGGDFIDSRATNYGYGRFRVARALMRRAFNRSAAVRVTTVLVRERALQLGARAEQLALIPRNIASYCFPPDSIPLDIFRAQAHSALAARYGLEQARTIATVGRLLPIKGFDILVRALPQILAQSDVRLLIVGPTRTDATVGDYQTYLETLAQDLKVREKIIFVGDVPHPEMRALLAGVDVVAIPSILEGMNKVAVEAAAVGTPGVVTRTAGIADLLAEANAGIVVPENSPEALAEGLTRLLCDESLRGQYAARGPAFAEQFSSQKIAADLITLCEQVLKGQQVNLLDY